MQSQTTATGGPPQPVAQSAFQRHFPALAPPVFMAGLAVFYTLVANGFSDHTSAEAPKLYGLIMLVLAVLVFFSSFTSKPAASPTHHAPTVVDTPISWRVSLHIFSMVAAFVLLVFAAGFYIAIPLFLVLFLVFVSRIPPLHAFGFATCAFALTWLLFSYVLNLEVYLGYFGGYI